MIALIFQCREIFTMLNVAYTNGSWIDYNRNLTISVGCACVQKSSTKVERFDQHVMERRQSLPNEINEILDD